MPESPEGGCEAHVVACGVNDPLNLGGMLRLMACFGASGELVVIYYGKGGKQDGLPDPSRRVSTDSPGFFELPEIVRLVASTARGAMALAGPLAPVSLADFLARDGDSSLPLVVLETAPGAQNICEMRLPARVRFVIGSEARGVSTKLLAALRPERGDALAFVPMPGPYPSLNAGMALACALYEYRRQWPGRIGA